MSYFYYKRLFRKYMSSRKYCPVAKGDQRWNKCVSHEAASHEACLSRRTITGGSERHLYLYCRILLFVVLLLLRAIQIYACTNVLEWTNP